MKTDVEVIIIIWRKGHKDLEKEYQCEERIKTRDIKRITNLEFRVVEFMKSVDGDKSQKAA